MKKNSSDSSEKSLVCAKTFLSNILMNFMNGFGQFRLEKNWKFIFLQFADSKSVIKRRKYIL